MYVRKNIEHNLKFVQRQTSIVFFGLGNMSKHMVTNLLSANHHVIIFDTNSKKHSIISKDKVNLFEYSRTS
jgi:3-hydroxyisobutyrate dehydrogenase-like beta-hydroxyacid dehydrogenase